MKKAILIIVVILVLLGIIVYQRSKTNSTKNYPNLAKSSMKISSPAFTNNSSIPSKYTCEGENVNPPLVFEDIPENTQSLVLIMDDPDIPEFVKEKYNIEVWDHWVIYNIPSDIQEIQENTKPEGKEGVNTGGDIGYMGPCPPDREHRYFFRLYALDTNLDLPEGANRYEVEQAMQGHIIDKAELIGLYEKQNK